MHNKTYESGAHFRYRELQRRLLDLFETLPLERLGNKGVYFQEEEDALKLLARCNKTPRLNKPNYYSPKNIIHFIPSQRMVALPVIKDSSKPLWLNSHQNEAVYAKSDSKNAKNCESCLSNNKMKVMKYESISNCKRKLAKSRIALKFNKQGLLGIDYKNNAKLLQNSGKNEHCRHRHIKSKSDVYSVER